MEKVFCPSYIKKYRSNVFVNLNTICKSSQCYRVVSKNKDYCL